MAVQDNPVLYQDPQIEVKFNPKSPEDHILYLHKPGGEEGMGFHIPRRCLEELAKTPRDKAEEKMKTLNDIMVRYTEDLGLSVDSLGYAMAQAYIEEKRRYDINERQMRMRSGLTQEQYTEMLYD